MVMLSFGKRNINIQSSSVSYRIDDPLTLPIPDNFLVKFRVEHSFVVAMKALIKASVRER